MASTTPLPALLQSLNIGVDRNTDEERKDATSSASAAPKLALTDQLHLLSAHIDTLEKEIQARVTSSAGKETIRRQGTEALRVRQRVSDVHSRVELLERQVNANDDQDRIAFLESLAQYASVRNDVKRRERLYKIAVLMKAAVVAVEELEGRVQSGQLEAEELRSSMEKVDAATSLLGLGSGKEAAAAPLEREMPGVESFAWLAQSGKSSPKAIRDLSSRIEAIKEQVRKELLQRWHSSLCIDNGEVTVRLTVTDVPDGKQSLSQLMETLQSRSELIALIEKLAHEISDRIVAPVFSASTQCRQEESAVSSWIVTKHNNGAEGSLNVTSAVSLVRLIQQEILAKAPPSSQALLAFSKIFVPRFVQSVIKYLKSALPSQLERPISNAILPRLHALSQEAKSVFEALLEGNFLQRDLHDEGEEIMNWSKDINRHCMRSLAARQRRKARELLLSEAGGGWQAVPVEFEVEKEESKAAPRQSSDAEEKEIEAVTSAANIPGDARDRNQASRKLEAALPESAASLARNSSLSGARSKQKKSALGGRRVVKPQDELGSGPFPEADNGDDVSWGFDDEIADRGVPNRAGPSRSSYDVLVQSLDREEDVDEDAWGLTEEEKVERAAKRASMRGDMAAAFQTYQASQEKTNALPQIADERMEEEGEEVDEAWGLSEQEQEALNKKRQSMLFPPGAAMRATAPLLEVAPTEAKREDDEDEDAWGLSAQEQEALNMKRRSMLMPTKTAAPFVANPVHEEGARGNDDVDDDDDDAWGLSAQEQEAIARKRQSVLFPPSQSMADPAGSEGGSLNRPEDRASQQTAIASADITPAVPLQKIPKQGNDEAGGVSSSGYQTADVVTTPRQPSLDFGRSEVDDEDGDDAWGLTDIHDNATQEENRPMTPESSLRSGTDLPSDRGGTTHSDTPKTSATSSSFTRTTRPLDMEMDESMGSVTGGTDGSEQAAETTETALEAWDARDDVLSGSEEAAAGGSRGGKSSGSGEKLSDTTTEPWEEISAPQDMTSVGATIGATAIAAAMTAVSQSHVSQTPVTNDNSQGDSAEPQRGDTNSDEALAGKSFHPTEKCVISKRSMSLISLIVETMDDIEAIVVEQQGASLDPVYLVDAINDSLDLHRALLPVGHADTLATVPSLGMQFANDCTYIGNRLKEMQSRWARISGQIAHVDEKLDFDRQAALTAALGARSFDSQILLQLKVLNDCLADTEGFTSTHEESRMQACQRSLKQVEFVLRQLQSAWKPVITRSSYLTAMGRLVDGILRRVLLDIEAIEDISEVESEKLAALIKTLGGLDFLFHDDGIQSDESVAALYVTSWFKASYLAEILTGSLVDIEFLYFEAGALVDYSKGEVISLIRSLFADTPKRSRLIDRIQSF